MFGWLLKRIFVDKKARQSMDAAGKTKPDPAPAAPGTPAEADAAEATGNGGEREQLINEAMSLYRERRAEYEKLDGNLRRKIDKAARKAFGDPDA